jgi:hypothetical protein
MPVGTHAPIRLTLSRVEAERQGDTLAALILTTKEILRIEIDLDALELRP